jgi:hypothetical protein
MRPCTNDGARKGAEVADGMRRFGNHAGMYELYRRGCFRHIEDVALARIMLERRPNALDAIAQQLDATYEGPHACVHHRCDRVYPPS